jgi:DNA invertase Pin-like site-specific DNA recombinase
MARKGHHIVALKLDRLFRDASDALAVTRTWDRAGVALHLIDMGGQAVNTGSAMGRMLLTVMAGFAELERGLIAERTAAALAHKRSRRETYNHAPLGFRDENGRLVPVEGEQKLVARIQAWRLKGVSLRRIADRLNAEGSQGKRAGRFHASTIRAILANPIHRQVAHRQVA